MSPWEIWGCPGALRAGGGEWRQYEGEGRRGFPGPIPPTLLFAKGLPQLFAQSCGWGRDWGCGHLLRKPGAPALQPNPA